MNTRIVIFIVIVICGLMVGGILISLSVIKRLKRRYWEIYQRIEQIQQQVTQIQQQATQIQQQVIQIQQQVTQIQQQATQIQQQATQIQQQVTQMQQQLNQAHQQIQIMHRHIELEQMSNLVKYSKDVGVIEQTAGIKMLKHIWKLKEENIDGNY